MQQFSRNICNGKGKRNYSNAESTGAALNESIFVPYCQSFSRRDAAESGAKTNAPESGGQARTGSYVTVRRCAGRAVFVPLSAASPVAKEVRQFKQRLQISSRLHLHVLREKCENLDVSALLSLHIFVRDKSGEKAHRIRRHLDRIGIMRYGGRKAAAIKARPRRSWLPCVSG